MMGFTLWWEIPPVSLHNSVLSLVIIICRMCMAMSIFFLAFPLVDFQPGISSLVTCAVSVGQILPV